MEILIFVIAAILIIFAIYEAYVLGSIRVTKNEVDFNNLPHEFNNYKIVQISDLHSKSFGKNNIKLIEKLDTIKPDVVFMTGDIVDRYNPKMDIIEKFISNVSKKYKVFYSNGNNELLLNDKKYDKLKQILKENGVIYLDNVSSKLYKEDEFIEIHGINYVGENKKIRFSQLYSNSNINPSSFNIALVHNPDECALYDNVDLFFCGHNHGGMIRLGKVGLYGPSGRFFIKFISGVYNISKRSKMIVSRGLGEGRAIIRINNFPDLVYTILKCKN